MARRARRMTIAAMAITAVVGGRGTSTTNAALVAAWRAQRVDAHWLDPSEAVRLLRPGDTAVGRVDVRRTLDGVEPGLLELLRLRQRGVRVLNGPGALLRTHDKLRTARIVAAAGLPHPETHWLPPDAAAFPLVPPFVVKPRFGSWGADVVRCDADADARSALDRLRARPWFRRQGALVQALVPPLGHDLRILVAAGTVVGSARRRARPGEWRTNYSLGGSLEPVSAAAEACALAVAAAAAVGGDFVGVDLLPANGGHVVLELNGAVDFEPLYGEPELSVYAAVARALALVVSRSRTLVA